MKEDLLYELTIEDENDFIYAISMVTEPAIESNWIYFGKEKVQLAKLDDEKRLVLGAILIPNKNILRLDGEGNPYHVFIKPETIKRLSEIYLEKKYTDAVTIEHQKPVDDITLVESWIVEDTKRDKSAVYGLSLPKGTWAGTMHVKNEQVWNEYVKTGILSGFSIEGIFSHQLVKNSKEPAYLQKEIKDLTDEEAKKLLTTIHSLLMDGVELSEPSVDSSYAGEPVSGSIAKQTFIEPNPCWDGYEAIGTKIDADGREVPNCVPIKID
jgi:hypothetical protein